VNQTFLQWLKPEQVEVDVIRLEEPNEVEIKASDLDELCGYCNRRIGWYTLDLSPRSEKCGNRGFPAWVCSMVGEPDRTNSASEAPFQDSGVFIRGFPPNKKTTRQADFASLATISIVGLS
jgi:hypothetical protein